MSSFDSLKAISLKSEYMELRKSLSDSFLVFVYFNPTIEQEEHEEFKDFIEGILTKFPSSSSKYDIILVPSNKAEGSLTLALTPEKKLEMPYFTLAHPHVAEAEVLQSNDSYFIYKTIGEYVDYYQSKYAEDKAKTLERIKIMVTSFPVVIYIKGSPHQPYCKFSKSFMEIIRNLKIDYRAYDIFRDPMIRGFMKFYHGFKTFPQIFIDGKIIGGLDTIKELHENNKLYQMIPESCKYESKITEVKKIVSENEKVLFYRSLIVEDKPTLGEDIEKIVKQIGDNLILIDVNKNLVYDFVLTDVYKIKGLPAYFNKGELKENLN